MKEKGLRDLSLLIAGTKVKKHPEGHILKGSGWAWHNEMPMIPGVLIKEVIERYKLPAKEFGWFTDMFGVRTNKQEFFWKDTGCGATFLGILNREDGKVDMPGPLSQEEMDKLEEKDYHFFGEMDLDLSKSKKEIFDRAWDIAGNCGYFVEEDKNTITLNASYGEGKFVLHFKNGIFDRVEAPDGEYLINEIPAYTGYRGGF